ncbi:hypothetical protein [Mycobacterium sp. DL440]|uniref:hypothetical protein n=1 Tax=Mycobacterium sp. DL440 TaxID=2675523 RepID=UPI0014209A2A|nr:hypothetical protein [Mycobacterium sp. DL440]
MTTIGYATLQLIPSLRGVREAIARSTRDMSITANLDVAGAREAGVRARREIRRGIEDARIASGLHRQVESELSSANASRIGGRFGSSLGASILGSIRGVSSGFDAVVFSGASVLRNVGAIATGTKIASVAARALSRSLLTAGGALALLGGGGLTRLAVGLQLVSRAAGGAARDIGRITSALIVLTAVGRGLSTLNRIGKIGALVTIGFSALLGVATAVVTTLGGPLVAALTAVGVAMGVAAGAAAGILGPALAGLAIGFKGLQDAAKAYTSGDDGTSQAKAVAAATKQVEQAENGVERAKRDSRDAERDLTRARKDAEEQIEDLNLALRGSALSEKDAQLSLLEARRDLQNLGKDGQSYDMLDRERAVLRVQEAEQRLAETQESNGDLAEKASEANRLGVEGSDEVVAAKQRVADASQAVIDAEQQVADARQAVADAQNQGQSGVDPFDAMIGQRMAPMLDAVKNLRHAVTDSLSGALTPAFASLGGLLDGLRPKMGVLAATMGGVDTAVATAISGPAAAAGFDKMISASKTFVGSLKTGMAGVSSGLVEFVGTAAQTFAGAGTGINDVLAGIGDRLRNITREQMIAAFDQLQQVFDNIRNVVGPTFSALRELGGITAPALAPGFQAIGAAIAQATPGVMTMARELMPALSPVMQNLAPVLPSLVDAFTPWASVVAVIAPHLATVVAHLGPLTPLILAATLAAKGIGMAMIVWQTAMGAVSIAQGVFIAATGASTLAIEGNIIALTAHKVAMIAGATAAKAVTAAQWLWNAAMTANPIGLVVAAIAGFVGGVIYAYKHSETFRNIVQGAWNAIKVAAKAVVDWFVDTAWPFLKQVWEGIGTGWNWLSTKAGEVWTSVKERFTAMVDWFRGLPTAIANAAKGMWESLKHGLVAVLNWIGDKWNAFADSLSFSIPGVVDVNVPKLPKFEAKDGFSIGGYTGDLPTEQIAGVVHGGEHVIKASSRQMLESVYPGLLEYMNNTGRLPGYSGGGRVAYGLPVGTNTGGYGSSGSVFPEWVHAVEKRFGVKASTYPGHQEKSGLNKGIDWVGSVPAMRAFAEYLKSIRGELEQVIWMNPNTGEKIGVADGQLVGSGTSQPGYYAKDWGGHTNHVHTRQSYSFGGSASASVVDTTPLAAGLGSTTGADIDTDPRTASPQTQAAVAASSSSGGTGNLPTSISGLSTWGIDSLPNPTAGLSDTLPDGGKNPWKQDSAAKFGEAASAAVSGQVSSALGVFGVPDSPGWLQGISTFVGGLSISDASGNKIFGGGSTSGALGGMGSLLGNTGQGDGYGGAAPIAAAPMVPTRVPDTGNLHGSRAGQQPGPAGPTYNIRTATVEDAFMQAQRQERVRLASKLDRY